MKDPGFIIDLDVTRISTMYAQKTGIAEDEALRIFLASATYRALIDTETGLCYEMFDHIFELFINEVNNDV